MRIEENHGLAQHTTLGVGGKARRYVEVETAGELVDALKGAHEAHLPVFILGGGSNVLVGDEGFEGVVIRLGMKGMTWESREGSEIVRVDAGAKFDDVVAESCRRGLAGIEALSGIPGSAGGALVQNIGAYGQEISECFVSARVIHRETLEEAEFGREAMAFGYRHTALKSANSPWVVTSLTLRLVPYDMQTAVKRCEAHGFKRLAVNRPRCAEALREVVLETRRSKGMVYDEKDVNTHSVGSFFVNPVVSEKDAQRHHAANILRNQKPMPSYPCEGGVKLSAAWLIEQSGFSRGFLHRGAGLSALHSLAIINRGGATSADVVSLAEEIVRGVYKYFRIELCPEVVYLGPRGVVEPFLKPVQ